MANKRGPATGAVGLSFEKMQLVRQKKEEIEKVTLVGCDAVILWLLFDFISFSALTLLVGWQEGHPACKKLSGGCWHGYLSGARCRIAYGPADATATHCVLLQ